MQTLQLMVMQHVELISAPCLLAHSCSQLNEAAKELHTMRVFVAAVYQSTPKRSMASVDLSMNERTGYSHLLRASQHLLSVLLLLLLIRRRRVASALWDVQLSNRRDVNGASAARAKTT